MRIHSLKLKNILLLLILIFGLCTLLFAFQGHVLADENPHRVKIVTVGYTEYEWWLVRWSDNRLVCNLYIDHEGKPTANDVYYQCEPEDYLAWLDTTGCPEADTDREKKCVGYYFQFVDSRPREKDVVIKLPEPKAWIDVDGCQIVGESGICEDIPSLFIYAEEPLPNEEIVQIQGRLNDIPFVCQGNECRVPLRPTDLRGISLEFWADSSYGDSSKHYRGRVRVADSGISKKSGAVGWHVDMMSEQYDNDIALKGCASIWEAFPPLGALPEWLENPEQIYQLETNEPYTFLAGQLIQKGYVDTKGCNKQGLLANGYASTCGLEKARLFVQQWQNNIDPLIIESAKETGIPSQLLKRIFAQESQFWPGTLDFKYKEYGLGQLTELGADTTLLWNKEFYEEFCPLILSNATCQKGYALLDEDEQSLLRGALLSQIDFKLPVLADDIDPADLQSSINLFSETLLANCNQAGHIITQQTNKVPGEVIGFEDLWRLTLVNYHAGSGCLASAVRKVHSSGKSLTWNNISEILNHTCPNAVTYVKKVTQIRSSTAIKYFKENK